MGRRQHDKLSDLKPFLLLLLFFFSIFVLSIIVRLQVMNHNVTRYLSICSNPSPKEKHD